MDNAGIFKKAPKYCQMYCIIFPPFALFTQAALLSAKLIPAQQSILRVIPMGISHEVVSLINYLQI